MVKKRMSGLNRTREEFFTGAFRIFFYTLNEFLRPMCATKWETTTVRLFAEPGP